MSLGSKPRRSSFGQDEALLGFLNSGVFKASLRLRRVGLAEDSLGRACRDRGTRWCDAAVLATAWIRPPRTTQAMPTSPSG
jgi:hypothetical protein